MTAQLSGCVRTRYTKFIFLLHVTAEVADAGSGEPIEHGKITFFSETITHPDSPDVGEFRDGRIDLEYPLSFSRKEVAVIGKFPSPTDVFQLTIASEGYEPLTLTFSLGDLEGCNPYPLDFGRVELTPLGSS